MRYTKKSKDDIKYDWVKLVDCDSQNMLFHGAVLRCVGKWPYEEIVDFMVFDNKKTDTGMGLIVTSGYKSGLILVYLPKESESGHEQFIDYVNLDWLKQNWAKWVYPNCAVDDVYVFDGYQPANCLPGI